VWLRAHGPLRPTRTVRCVNAARVRFSKRNSGSSVNPCCQFHDSERIIQLPIQKSSPPRTTPTEDRPGEIANDKDCAGAHKYWPDGRDKSGCHVKRDRSHQHDRGGTRQPVPPPRRIWSTHNDSLGITMCLHFPSIPSPERTPFQQMIRWALGVNSAQAVAQWSTRQPGRRIDQTPLRVRRPLSGQRISSSNSRLIRVASDFAWTRNWATSKFLRA
jgi:hypothetical protein